MLARFYKILNKAFWTISNARYQSGKQYPSPIYSTFDDQEYLKQIPISYHKVLKSQRCTIEPSTGWAISGRVIFGESYAFWTNVAQGWPPLPSLIKHLSPFKKTTIIPKAVSFHYGWDNYYHFFTDTLPQIKYWIKNGKSNVPWIVPKKIKNISFVQHYLIMDPILDGHEIIYQEPNEYIKVTKEISFIKRSRVGSIELKTSIDHLLSISKSSNHSKDQKIFLIREGHRSASNLNELIDIASSFGFKTIKTDCMNLSEQIKLFSSTRWLIGFHGAGLTNMIFRKDQKMSILELFPKNKMPLHYWHLTIDFGFNYSFCVGDNYTSEDEVFHLNPEKFRNIINTMLNQDPALSL